VHCQERRGHKKSKGKNQKAKGQHLFFIKCEGETFLFKGMYVFEKKSSALLPFDICLLPFDFTSPVRAID
jgi:hypothetical protein